MWRVACEVLVRTHRTIESASARGIAGSTGRSLPAPGLGWSSQTTPGLRFWRALGWRTRSAGQAPLLAAGTPAASHRLLVRGAGWGGAVMLLACWGWEPGRGSVRRGAMALVAAGICLRLLLAVVVAAVGVAVAGRGGAVA